MTRNRLVSGGVALTTAALLALPLAGCGASNTDSTPPTPSAPTPSLTEVYDACAPLAKPSALLRLEDEGKTLLLEMPPLNDNKGATCVLERLATPTAITAQIESTAPGTPTTTVTDGPVTYTWTAPAVSGTNPKIIITTP